MTRRNRRVAAYTRVSTDGQSCANQERELRAVAEHKDCEIIKVYTDHGVSGAKGRDKRPQFDALCRDEVRREFDVIMAWSVDRLGRSLQDLIAFPNEIHAAGVDLTSISRDSIPRRQQGKPCSKCWVSSPSSSAL